MQTVKTITGLGIALDRQGLTEEVEDEAQADKLRSFGVEVGQGWLFARALPAQDATTRVIAQASA